MKEPKLVVAIDQIPEPGLVIEGELPPEWLESSLLEPYRATEPVTINVEVKAINTSVIVQGSIQTTLKFVCGRTTQIGSMPIEIEFNELCQPTNQAFTKLGDGIESDLIGDEPYLYDGRDLDVEPILREEIVLAQPPYPHVSGEKNSEEKAVWSSGAGEIDARWEKLKGLKLN